MNQRNLFALAPLALASPAFAAISETDLYRMVRVIFRSCQPVTGGGFLRGNHSKITLLFCALPLEC